MVAFEGAGADVGVVWTVAKKGETQKVLAGAEVDSGSVSVLVEKGEREMPLMETEQSRMHECTS